MPSSPSLLTFYTAFSMDLEQLAERSFARVQELLNMGIDMEVQQTSNGPAVLIKCSDPLQSAFVPELNRLALFLCGVLPTPYESSNEEDTSAPDCPPDQS